jgi:hypothetical protein
MQNGAINGTSSKQGSTEDSSQFEVSPTSFSSPDSYGSLSLCSSGSLSLCSSGSESLTMSEIESIIQSQSSESESLTTAEVPLPMNSSSPDSSFEELRQPIDPRLIPQFLEIMSRPGPKSSKLKRLAELVSINSQEVPKRNIPPAESNENLHKANILRMIRERTRLNSTSSESASSSLASNSPSQPIPAITQSSQDENLRLSPRGFRWRIGASNLNNWRRLRF